MAGLELNYATAGTALVAATAKTLLKIPSVADRRQQVVQIEVNCTDIDPTNNHILVEILRQAAAESGAGTSTALSPVLSEPDAPEAAAAITAFPARRDYSAEPTWGTAPTLIMGIRVHPQGTRVLMLSDAQGRIEGLANRALYVQLTSPDGIAGNVTVNARTLV